jgi:hypothetical protein
MAMLMMLARAWGFHSWILAKSNYNVTDNALYDPEKGCNRLSISPLTATLALLHVPKSISETVGASFDPLFFARIAGPAIANDSD